MISKTIAFAIAALTLATSSAAQAADCRLVKLAELPVTMVGLRPLVPAKINGKDAKFLVDSGMFYSLINTDAVPEFGLKTYSAPAGFYIRGIGSGHQSAEVSKVTEFVYAGIPIKNIEFLVSGGGYAPGAAGIIGQNLLGASDIEYDLANGVIRLFKAQNCASANLAYWSAGKALSVLPTELQTPLKTHIIVQAQVDGRWIRAIFDTGASTSVLSRPAAERVGVKPSSDGVSAAGFSTGFGGKHLETSIATFQSFAIGNEEIKNARLRVTNLELDNADMLIGDDFFLSHRVMVARSQRKLYFTYNGGPVFRLDQKPTEVADAGAPHTTDVSSDGPKTADDFSRRGAASAARREFTAAINDFTKAIELEPNESRHYHDRALARLNNRQAVLAMADLSQALKLKPDDTATLVVRGELYLSQGDRAAAQSDFDAAMKLAPNEDGLPIQFANAYARARLYDTAILQFSGWIDTHPKNPLLGAAYQGRCRARALWGKDLTLALSDCDEALKHDQKTSLTFDSRGLVLLRMGRYDDAIKQYDAAIRAQPKDAWSLYGRGLAKQAMADPAAKADLDAAAQVEPNIVRITQSYGVTPAPEASHQIPRS